MGNDPVFTLWIPTASPGDSQSLFLKLPTKRSYPCMKAGFQQNMQQIYGFSDAGTKRR